MSEEAPEDLALEKAIDALEAVDPESVDPVEIGRQMNRLLFIARRASVAQRKEKSA